MKKEKRHIIGVDLDDTIFDFNNSLHAYHNKMYGTNITRENITSYELTKVWGYTEEEVEKKLFEFYFTSEHDLTSPVIGSLDAITTLKCSSELHLITVRGDLLEVPTINWINKHFADIFTTVNLTNKIFGKSNKICSKSDVCRKLNIDIMIEDSLAQALEISPVIKKVYLFDCPWNQGDLLDNVTRVFSWKEILEKIYADKN